MAVRGVLASRAGGQSCGNRMVDGLSPASSHLSSGSVVLDSVRATVQAGIFPVVGGGLDIIRNISRHHCVAFASCSGMDALQEQPGSAFRSCAISPTFSIAVSSMEHALKRIALALGEVGSRNRTHCWSTELCGILYVSGAAGHQSLFAVPAVHAGAWSGLVVLRVLLF